MKAEIKVRYMILRHRSKTVVENHFEEREERTLREVQLRRWALHGGSCLGTSTRLKAPSKSTVVFLGSGNGHRGEGADKQNKHRERWASFPALVILMLFLPSDSAQYSTITTATLHYTYTFSARK